MAARKVREQSQSLTDMAWVPWVCKSILFCGLSCGVLMMCWQWQTAGATPEHVAAPEHTRAMRSLSQNKDSQAKGAGAMPEPFAAPEHIRAMAMKHLGEDQAKHLLARARCTFKNYKGKRLIFWHNEEDSLDFNDAASYQFHKLADLTVPKSPKSMCKQTASTTNGRCGPHFGRCNGKHHHGHEALFCGVSAWCGNASDPHRRNQSTDIFDFRPRSCSLLESGDEVIANERMSSVSDVSAGTTGMVVHVDGSAVASVKWKGTDKIHHLSASDWEVVEIKWKGAFVVDVGANLGDTAIIAHLENKRLQILSLEPSPVNYIFMRWNLFSNRIPELTEQQFSAREYGVLALLGGATKDGRPIELAFAPEQSKHAQARSDFAAIGFEVPPDAGGSHALTGNEVNKYMSKFKGTWTQFIVPSFALPAWLEKHNAPVIKWFKMDCEGCEYETLIDLVSGGFLTVSIVVGEAHYRQVPDLVCAQQPDKIGCKDMVSTMLAVRSIMCLHEYRFQGCNRVTACDVFQSLCTPEHHSTTTPQHPLIRAFA